MGGAFASLSMTSKAVADAASRPAARTRRLRRCGESPGSDAPAPAIGEAGGAPARSEIRPRGDRYGRARLYRSGGLRYRGPGRGPSCGGPSRDAGAGDFGPWRDGARAAGRRDRFDAAECSGSRVACFRRLRRLPLKRARPQRAGADRRHGASWRDRRTSNRAQARRPGPSSSTSAAAASGASAVEPPRRRPGTALPRSTRPFVRATADGACVRDRLRRARSFRRINGRGEDGDASEAGDPGAAGGQGASSPLQGAASTNPFGAASSLAVPAQGGAASSTPLGLVGGARCADERASGCGFHRPARP